MLEDLTLTITEQANGVRSTYHLHYIPKEVSSLSLKPNFIIDLLKQEFTRLGLAQSTDGKTSATFIGNGGTSISSQG